MLPPRLISRSAGAPRACVRGAVRVCAAAALVAIAAAVALLPAPAAAYVRSRSDGYAPLYWRDPRQVLELAVPRPSTGLTPQQFRSAAEEALRAWSEGAIGCTSVNLTAAPEMSEDQVAKRDGRNRIAMRVGAWCRDPEARTDCHNPEAIATTTRFSRNKPGDPDDGRIIEADIEVNAVDWSWAVIPEQFSGRDYANVFDLASALTHETGHFIGLDHSCSLDRTALIDDAGRPVPLCTAIPDSEYLEIIGATMYPTTRDASIDWRTLTDDDKRAACEMYPPAALPLDEWVGMGGCAVGGTSPSGAGTSPESPVVAWAVLAAAAVLARRSRARRGRFVRRTNAR